jgi:hypothetical protein
MPGLHPYLDLVVARAPAAAREWLIARAGALGADSFGPVYSGVGRRLGSAAVALDAGERAGLSRAGLPLPEGWPLAAVGRAGLLATVMQGLGREARVQLAQSVFKTGDNEERAALLKALTLLPEPEAFVELAIDSCRSHVQSVFEAIACENPYPARWFPEPSFNQLVLKAFFVGVAVRRVQGLASRRSPELVRMALAYASERRAAGREVPPDLELVTAPALDI